MSAEKFTPPMVMVVTVPLRQPCTTAWSYVHNGFRAAGEGPPLWYGCTPRSRSGGMLSLDDTSRERSSIIHRSREHLSRNHAILLVFVRFPVMQRPGPPLWDGGTPWLDDKSSSYFWRAPADHRLVVRWLSRNHTMPLLSKRLPSMQRSRCSHRGFLGSYHGGGAVSTEHWHI